MKEFKCRYNKDIITIKEIGKTASNKLGNNDLNGYENNENYVYRNKMKAYSSDGTEIGTANFYGNGFQIRQNNVVIGTCKEMKNNLN